jgi:aerobic C4-dicarboxylate transport protein
MASLFLAQAVGIDLSWQQQLVMVGIMMLTSKGTAGIAGGAFIVLASTITAVGHVPLAALALIVGIDRLLNEGRVFINVLGNALAAIVIGKWENDFDSAKAASVLSGEDPFTNTSNADTPPADSAATSAARGATSFA